MERKQMISEEEAKRLLADEKMRLEQGWKKADERRKRIVKIAVVVAVAVCVIGVVLALVARK